MRPNLFFPQINFNAPDPAQGGGGQGDQNAGGGEQGGNPPAWKAPDGMPTHLVGKDAGETLGKVWTAYEGARKDIAERGQVPTDYELKFSDKAAPVLNIQSDDKVLPILKKAMKEHGITDKQSGFVGALIDGIIDAGILPKPVDPNQLWASMAPEAFRGSDIEKIAEGQKVQREAITWLDGLKAQPGFAPEMKAELELLTGSAAGMKTLKWLMGQGVQKSVQPGGQGNGSAASKGDLDARRADPRNQYGDPKYDPAFAAETRELYKKVYQG